MVFHQRLFKLHENPPDIGGKSTKLPTSYLIILSLLSLGINKPHTECILWGWGVNYNNKIQFKLESKSRVRYDFSTCNPPSLEPDPLPTLNTHEDQLINVGVMATVKPKSSKYLENGSPKYDPGLS